MQELGFIFPRCVREKRHDFLWKECYSSIRASFPTTPIVIIDDGSTYDLVDHSFEEGLTNTIIHYNRKYPGAGELLPYIYLQEFRPFQKAVCMNDSMFIQEGNAAQLMDAIQRMSSGATFLWNFESTCNYGDMDEQYEMISLLHPDVRERMKDLFNNRAKWSGCFATASIVTIDLIDILDARYDFFNVAKVCKSRPYRCGLERIFAICCYDLWGAVPNVNGSILYHRHAFHYTYEQYKEDKKKGVVFPRSCVKVWNSR